MTYKLRVLVLIECLLLACSNKPDKKNTISINIQLNPLKKVYYTEKPEKIYCFITIKNNSNKSYFILGGPPQLQMMKKNYSSRFQEIIRDDNMLYYSLDHPKLFDETESSIIARELFDKNNEMADKLENYTDKTIKQLNELIKKSKIDLQKYNELKLDYIKMIDNKLVLKPGESYVKKINISYIQANKTTYKIRANYPSEGKANLINMKIHRLLRNKININKDDNNHIRWENILTSNEIELNVE
jgi:hypothetical protein